MKTLSKVSPLSILTLLVFVLTCFTNCGDDDSPEASNQVTITSMDPPSPADLVFYQTAPSNDRVSIEYNYTITNPDGARIWVQPYTNGSISDDFLYSPSSVLQGSGSRSVIISIDQGSNAQVEVDQLRIIMTDPDQNQDLFEDFINVDYTFSN